MCAPAGNPRNIHQSRSRRAAYIAKDAIPHCGTPPALRDFGMTGTGANAQLAVGRRQGLEKKRIPLPLRGIGMTGTGKAMYARTAPHSQLT